MVWRSLTAHGCESAFNAPDLLGEQQTCPNHFNFKWCSFKFSDANRRKPKPAGEWIREKSFLNVGYEKNITTYGQFQGKDIKVTHTNTVTEPSDSHTPDLHPGSRARLPADWLPHRQRQRSSQGEPGQRELRGQMWLYFSPYLYKLGCFICPHVIFSVSPIA